MIQDIKTYFRLLQIANKVRSTQKYKDALQAQQDNQHAIRQAQDQLKSIKGTIPFSATRAKAKRALAVAQAEQIEVEKQAIQINEYLATDPIWKLAIGEIYPSLGHLKLIIFSYFLVLFSLLICAMDFTIPQRFFAFTAHQFLYIGIIFVFFKRFDFKNAITISNN